MIILKDVCKRYGNTITVDHLTLHIKQGEFFGLLGPNGAGKTTTVRMMMALTNPTSGEICINGIAVNRNDTSYKAQIGLVPQHNNLEGELTVMENLRLHGLLYQLPAKTMNERIPEILSFTDLADKAHSAAHILSGGMKRKLLIARALMHNPHILILDEPTVGLDVFARRKVWDLMKGLYARGMTIILTTHYLEEAEALCSRIGLMKKGRLITTGSLEDIKEKVGRVVVEQFVDNETKLHFFDSNAAAFSFAQNLGENIMVRQTKLEDVFVKLAGESEKKQ